MDQTLFPHIRKGLPPRAPTFKSLARRGILFGWLLIPHVSFAAPKVVLPEDKCVENLESLAKTISGHLDSYVYYGKTPGAKSTSRKEALNASSETSESKLKVTVGQDVFEFIVKDLYECRVEKLSVTKGE